MPTYEFRCPDGHEFEKFYRTISGAASEAVCPVCGKVAERFMSAAGFAFKGSGFYLTDYGKNAHRDKGTPEPKSGEPSGKESSGDSSAKSDGSGSSGDSKSAAASSDGAKSSDSSSNASKSEKSAEKKADSKPAESKPAKSPPKTGTSE